MQNTGRKIFKAIGVFVLLLVICILFALSLLGLSNSRKSSFNDSDLIFNRPQIPIESNAFYTLLKATNELYWPKKLERKLDDLSDDTNWDDSLAAEILETNRACLNSFDKAMQQPFLLVPEVKSFDEDESYLGGWKQLSTVKSIQIFSLHHAGKDKEAFDSAFEIINFGQRIENSGGPVIEYLVGESVKSIGLTYVRRMTADTTLSKDPLTKMITRLNNFGPNLEGLTNALKVEYTTQCHYLDNTAEDNIPGTTNSGFERVAVSIGMKPFFSPRRTKTEFAQADRFILSNFSKPYVESMRFPMPNAKTNVPIFNLLISGNAMGEIFFEMLEPEQQIFAKSISREHVNVTATQLMLALKVCKIEHGRLPDSLSELVPEFFPQVPLDDFDGQPFRYLPNKKIIYSVGTKLKDFGGKEYEKNSNDYNLPFRIEF